LFGFSRSQSRCEKVRNREGRIDKCMIGYAAMLPHGLLP
jgi:hypothetical protein